MLVVAVPVRVRVRRIGPRFLLAARGDGLSRESPWTFGPNHVICASVWWWAGHVSCAVTTIERKCLGWNWGQKSLELMLTLFTRECFLFITHRIVVSFFFKQCEEKINVMFA